MRSLSREGGGSPLGGGGGSKIGKLMKQKKKPKSTMLADNTQARVDNNNTNKAQAIRFCSTALQRT